MFEANTDASMVLWKDRMMDLGEYYTTVYPQTNGQPYGDSIVGAYNVRRRLRATANISTSRIFRSS